VLKRLGDMPDSVGSAVSTGFKLDPSILLVAVAAAAVGDLERGQPTVL
jgi:hypothetical protein